MKQRNLVIFLVPIFILTVLWVIFNVYHNYISSTITDPLTYQIVPIEGKFDSATIEAIKQRKRVSPSNEIIVETTDEEIDPQLDEEEASESAEIDSDEEQEEDN